MANYQYYQPGASLSGCPGTALAGGWYEYGSNTPIVSDYYNPATGMAYTPQELGGLGGGGTATAEPAPAGYGEGGAYTSPFNQWLAETYPDVFEAGNLTAEQQAQYAEEFTAAANVGGWSVGENQQLVKPTTPSAPTGTIPTAPAMPAVTPAPPYEPSPEQLAWEAQYSGMLTEWTEAGGYGIPEDIKAKMIQQTTDTLKARETERIRVMQNTMERRGLTNSGLLFSETQKIKSDTTYNIARSITDIEIKSALLKMASFEKAMGATAQFLGYLSTQSQLSNQPKYLTWQAEQMAKLQGWQAKMDVYKMEINQAYTQQNIQLTADLQAEAAAQQNIWDVEMMEMEAEAANQAAATEGFFGLVGLFVTATL